MFFRENVQINCIVTILGPQEKEEESSHSQDTNASTTSTTPTKKQNVKADNREQVGEDCGLM